MDISSIALQGMTQAEAQLEAAASAIAQAGNSSADGANLDVVELSTEMVAMMSARNQFALNVSTLKTADEVQKSLLNITA